VLGRCAQRCCTRVLRDKPVAAGGASTGMFGAAWAQAELLRTAGARVLAHELAVARADVFGTRVGERLTDLPAALLDLNLASCRREPSGGARLAAVR
jgi:hypothetical protein